MTEQLKAEQPMEWIGLMNNIQAYAREIVNNEIIFFILTPLFILNITHNKRKVATFSTKIKKSTPISESALIIRQI